VRKQNFAVKYKMAKQWPTLDGRPVPFDMDGPIVYTLTGTLKSHANPGNI